MYKPVEFIKSMKSYYILVHINVAQYAQINHHRLPVDLHIKYINIIITDYEKIKQLQ